ncbi:shikimate dehydrogenase [Prochlorococcus sp. MIT 0916]|uniref:Shikimate dehydrogenase (NADP(+)) n=1 Tax=Prochlorococcus marinus str. P0903-H212 TaxID=1622208 RepID=A0A0D5A463_PROMR|nr:Shikimate 5-dehydrogenase I alpha [Prochlorococcus marinus str. P0903-H212]
MITITGKTNLVGLLGQPVNHSLSPIMHNAAYEEMGLDWCYLAMPCESKDLKKVTQALRYVDCKGLNITIPHKQEVLKACHKLTEIANDVQAVNTLIPEKNNRWIGANTDIEGFLMPLKDHNLRDKNVIVIGCGGSARAVVMGLSSLNIKKLTIIGRNPNSLDFFVRSMKNVLSTNHISIEGIDNKELNVTPYIEEADLIINTTPIGMNGTNAHQKNIPLGNEIWDCLSNKTILYDLIYTPKPTNWLKLGQQKNCFTIDGLDMLVEQGAFSIRLWSGINDVPVQTMKSSAEKHLMV